MNHNDIQLGGVYEWYAGTLGTGPVEVVEIHPSHLDEQIDIIAVDPALYHLPYWVAGEEATAHWRQLALDFYANMGGGVLHTMAPYINAAWGPLIDAAAPSASAAADLAAARDAQEIQARIAAAYAAGMTPAGWALQRALAS